MIFIQKQAPGFQKLTNQSGMGKILGAPVHKGLKARTEASRVVPMPDAAKDQGFTKKRKKNAVQFVIKYPIYGRTPFLRILGFSTYSRLHDV